MKLFRSGWWPGHGPTIDRNRIMCSDCRWHNAAPAGWQYDRCRNPKADLGSIVRNDQIPTCHNIRHSDAQCGLAAVWFAAKEPT